MLRGYGGGQIRIVRDKETTRSYKYSLDTPYELFVDKNGDVYINDEFITSIGNVTVNNANQSTLILTTYYAQPSATYGLKGKLYYCQIFQNGEMVRDFVPCINPDGLAGLYDLVECKFYKGYSAGEEV